MDVYLMRYFFVVNQPNLVVCYRQNIYIYNTYIYYKTKL